MSERQASSAQQPTIEDQAAVETVADADDTKLGIEQEGSAIPPDTSDSNPEADPGLANVHYGSRRGAAAPDGDGEPRNEAADETGDGATARAAIESDVPLATAPSGEGALAVTLDFEMPPEIAASPTPVTITINGLPESAALSAGVSHDNGSWTVQAEDLPGLTVSPPDNGDMNFYLTVKATTIDANGDVNDLFEASIAASLDRSAETPTLSVTPVAGGEDTAIALNIETALSDTDGSESLTITIADVPAGATLSTGVDNGDGTWSLTADDLPELSVTPPADSDADFALAVTVTSTEADGGHTATVTGTIDVSVNAHADAPSLILTSAEGAEDTAISLNIDAALLDSDGSESLSITIADVPAGATLSAGVDNGDGTWSLTADDLPGLSVTPAADSDADFALSVTATSTEVNGNTATTQSTLDVSVEGQADSPALKLSDAGGEEDSAIALDISASLSDTDGSETLSIRVEGVPDGAALSAGTNNGDGSWSLSPDELSGLTVTPPANSSDDFSLTVTATSTEADGSTASLSETLEVSVDAQANVDLDGTIYADVLDASASNASHTIDGFQGADGRFGQ